MKIVLWIISSMFFVCFNYAAETKDYLGYLYGPEYSIKRPDQEWRLRTSLLNHSVKNGSAASNATDRKLPFQYILCQGTDPSGADRLIPGNYLFTTPENDLYDSEYPVHNLNPVLNLKKNGIKYERYDTICSYDSIRIGNSIYHETGTYIDTLLTPGGLDSVLTTHLWVSPPIGLNFRISNPTCHDHADGSIDILVFDFLSGLRFFLNNKEITQVQLRNLAAGEYLIKAEDRMGCGEEEKLTLTNPALLSLDIGRDRLVNYGDSLTVTALTNMTASDIKSILWTSTPVQSHCPGCLPEITYFPAADHSLKVILESFSGCKIEREISIRINREFNLYIPNIFRPGITADPKNKYLTVYGGQLVSRVNYLRIYNRFGSQVFEANDFLPNELNSGWDGRFNDQDAPQDVYLFIAEVQFTDGSYRQVKGDFLLLR